jgi:alpha-glucosidase
LIELRQSEPLLREGKYQPLRSRNDILSFKRVQREAELVVALNFVHQPRRWEWRGCGTLLLSTGLDRQDHAVDGTIVLRPDEGIIVRVDAQARG